VPRISRSISLPFRIEGAYIVAGQTGAIAGLPGALVDAGSLTGLV
jgi:hypothetical protein